MGEEKGKALITRAITNYGAERGERRQRALFAELGYDNYPANYGLVLDNLQWGWEADD